jgi:glycosyltransferase involved in cell wall biosynthesis
MSAGLAVLSVDFPEMRQIITEEECGILIYDQGVESIIEAIETLLNNPEKLSTMSKNGQRAARERYSWDVMEKKLLLGYERLSRMAC